MTYLITKKRSKKQVCLRHLDLTVIGVIRRSRWEKIVIILDILRILNCSFCFLNNMLESKVRNKAYEAYE